MPLTMLVQRCQLLSLFLLLRGGLSFAAALRENIFLSLARLAVEDGTDRFLAGGKVGGDIEQHVGTGGTASRKLVHQIPAVMPWRKALMTSTSVTLGSSVHCLEKHWM